ncbi:MAG: carboxylating nicotinate-nucleotide diphosphorylase [Candidatus Izimaplasma sp.]|nr:carboxylating nicotinate-nucleotide diphosphorylase [Candidatus Izimaplasma bacterium]
MDLIIDEIINNAIKEDIPTLDITSDNLFAEQEYEGVLIAKQTGVISGMMVFKRVFEIMDASVTIKIINGDGSHVDTGDILAIIKGKAKSILKSERLALNILQRMSGIATLTNKFVKKTLNTNAKILDTRKTTPNLRYLEKMAVRHGGGTNHRFSLSDQVMIKDNHIKAVGSITKAVTKIKASVKDTVKIEVEVETMAQFKEALNTACDIIMLDNMSNELMRQCVILNDHQKQLEASGNMTLDRIESVSQTGVDFISVGKLTHSYEALDISLKF